MPINVSVVEDHGPYRDYLRALLSGSDAFVCVGVHGTAEAARKRIPAERPDVALLDLELPGRWGQTLIPVLRAALPRLSIILLTVHDEPQVIFNALEAGAHGYLVKPSSPTEILEAIAEVHRGGAPMSSGIARLVIRSFHQRGQAKRSLDTLSGREMEVLDLVAKGCRSKEIAETLGIAVDTVRCHLHQIYTKLHVSTRSAATAKYLGS